MITVSTFLETLSRETNKTEAEIMIQAVEVGLRHLWRERQLELYLKKQISREAAVEAVGLDWVELAEKQHQAMLEDISWAFEA